MTDKAFIVEIRFPDGRYHGVGDWPPCPFRLFQALVASIYGGHWSIDNDRLEIKETFRKLEACLPPTIVAPKQEEGRRIKYYVPNNDIDSVDGDSAKAAAIYTDKTMQPKLFDPNDSFLYAWPWETDRTDKYHLKILQEATMHLCQFGRGIDPAYGVSEIIDMKTANMRLETHSGNTFRPNFEGAGSGNKLRCPTKGSFKSLEDRHAAQRNRQSGGILRQAPPSKFQTILYDSRPTWLLFDLISATSDYNSYHSMPHQRAATLTLEVRDRAAKRLEPHISSDIVKRFVVGHSATENDKTRRIRFLPLPSIGHSKADLEIRRVLVEIPPNCPISSKDAEWSLSGQTLSESQVLTLTDNKNMLEHYGVGVSQNLACHWRSVTPVALPVPTLLTHRMTGKQRHSMEETLVVSALQALRHAGFNHAKVDKIHVQREPFDLNGSCADAFERPSRFSKAYLTHIEIIFREPVGGPIVIGNGRYLGLGLMAPHLQPNGDT